jgi:hypothetical protein
VWEWQRFVGHVAKTPDESRGHSNREELIASREQLTRQIAILEGERRPEDQHPENVAKIRTALAEIESTMAEEQR